MTNEPPWNQTNTGRAPSEPAVAAGVQTFSVRHACSSVSRTFIPGTISPSGPSSACGAAGPNPEPSGRLAAEAPRCGPPDRGAVAEGLPGDGRPPPAYER